MSPGERGWWFLVSLQSTEFCIVSPFHRADSSHSCFVSLENLSKMCDMCHIWTYMYILETCFVLLRSVTFIFDPFYVNFSWNILLNRLRINCIYSDCVWKTQLLPDFCGNRNAHYYKMLKLQFLIVKGFFSSNFTWEY